MGGSVPQLTGGTGRSLHKNKKPYPTKHQTPTPHSNHKPPVVNTKTNMHYILDSGPPCWHMTPIGGGAADDTNNRLLGYPCGATSQPTVRAAHPHQPDHRPPLTTTKNVNQNKTHLNTQKLTPTPNQRNPFACLGFLLGLCCHSLCGCGCVCCGGGRCPRTPPHLCRSIRLVRWLVFGNCLPFEGSQQPATP